MTDDVTAARRPSPNRPARPRRALVVLAIVVGASVPVSSALLAIGGSTAVDGAAVSAGLQPAVRVSVPKVTAPPPTAPPPPAARLSDLEQELLDLTNAERARFGLAPLIQHDLLSDAADIHGNDQRNKSCSQGSLTHTGSDGSSAGDRIKRTGLSVRDWAENIACGFATPRAVLDVWMASSGHRANILNPRLTHIGLSLTYSDLGTPYWVQDFALPR